jgi:hypothetical protein
MKTSTRDMINQFHRMNTGKDGAARYNLACWLWDNHRYLRAIRTQQIRTK